MQYLKKIMKKRFIQGEVDTKYVVKGFKLNSHKANHENHDKICIFVFIYFCDMLPKVLNRGHSSRKSQIQIPAHIPQFKKKHVQNYAENTCFTVKKNIMRKPKVPKCKAIQFHELRTKASNYERRPCSQLWHIIWM